MLLTEVTNFAKPKLVFLNYSGLVQSSPTFLAWQTSGRKKGWFCVSGGQAHTQLHLYIHTNGMCAHALSHCLRNQGWACARPPLLLPGSEHSRPYSGLQPRNWGPPGLVHTHYVKTQQTTLWPSILGKPAY